MTDKDWLRAPCAHDWRLGPLTDMLMRQRPAVCVKCWEYMESMPASWWWDDGQITLPIWSEADYRLYKDEVERRFFSNE